MFMYKYIHVYGVLLLLSLEPTQVHFPRICTCMNILYMYIYTWNITAANHGANTAALSSHLYICIYNIYIHIYGILLRLTMEQTQMHFPRNDNCEIIYCNIEGACVCARVLFCSLCLRNIYT